MYQPTKQAASQAMDTNKNVNYQNMALLKTVLEGRGMKHGEEH
mgnify:CR=1 FL=1